MGQNQKGTMSDSPNTPVMQKTAPKKSIVPLMLATMAAVSRANKLNTVVGHAGQNRRHGKHHGRHPGAFGKQP